MSRHEGVSCDFCMRANFRGKRYKCLVCYDYDLCELCFASNFNSTTTNTSPSLQHSSSNAASSTPGGTSTTASASATASTSHTSDHAMQCILTQSDFELFYAGENVGGSSSGSGGGSSGGTALQSITCPICGSMGFTEATLITHVSQTHSSHTQDVVCPLCATLPNGDPNFVTDDYTRHLTRVHASPRANSSNGASSSAGGNGGGSEEERNATGATSSRETNSVVPPISRRRGGSGAACGSSGVFHSGRAILRRRNGGVLNLTSSTSATTSVGGGPTGTGNGGGSGASSSSNNNSNSNHATTTHSSHSLPASGSSLRDAVDPIAELLSQLSGVRRGGGGGGPASRTNAEHQAVLNSTASHLQQLQWQLQMERQNVQAAARDHLSRIPRRAYGASSYSQQSSVVSQGANAGADPLPTGGGGPNSAGSGVQAHGSSPSSSTFQSPIFATDLLYDSRYLLRDFTLEDVEKTSDDQQTKGVFESAHGDIEEKSNFVEDLTFSLLKLDMNDSILQTAISSIPTNYDVINNDDVTSTLISQQMANNSTMSTQMQPNSVNNVSLSNHVAGAEAESNSTEAVGIIGDKGRSCQRQNKAGTSSTTAQL